MINIFLDNTREIVFSEINVVNSRGKFVFTVVPINHYFLREQDIDIY